MKLIKELENFGLSGKMAQIYVAGLELGRFTVAEVADKSSLKRSTCYPLLDELVKKGLISVDPSRLKNSYIAESPSILVNQVEQNSLLMKNLSPELFALYQSTSRRPSMRFYVGVKGVKTVMEDLFRGNVNDAYYMNSARTLLNLVGKEYYDGWISKRVRLGIRSHGVRIGAQEVKGDIYQGTNDYLRELRIAPAGIKIPDTIMIYDNRVSVISAEGEGFAFILEGKNFFESMKGLWDALWMVSK